MPNSFFRPAPARAPTPVLPWAIVALALGACGAPEQPGPDAGAPDSPDDAGELPPDAGPSALQGMPAVPGTVARAKADCSNGRFVRLRRAVDGDTVELTVTVNGRNEHVRLIGVNTPESVPPENTQCFGPEASAYTHALVDAGIPACLTFDPAVTRQSNNLDAYGRTLAYVFFGENYGRFLNAELVWLGYARDFPFTPGTVYASYFLSLARSAQASRRGLWAPSPRGCQ